jgi:hypothetical protein
MLSFELIVSTVLQFCGFHFSGGSHVDVPLKTLWRLKTNVIGTMNAFKPSGGIVETER